MIPTWFPVKNPHFSYPKLYQNIRNGTNIKNASSSVFLHLPSSPALLRMLLVIENNIKRIYNLRRVRAQICKRSNHNSGSWVVLGYGLFGSPKILFQKISGCGKRFIPIVSAKKSTIFFADNATFKMQSAKSKFKRWLFWAFKI